MPSPRPRRTAVNPIQAAVQRWTSHFVEPGEGQAHSQNELVRAAPKRFTIYEPMALLPTGSFSGEVWKQELSRHSQTTLQQLWTLVLEELSRNAKEQLTHLAINEGIPSREKGSVEENVLRSPSGLRILQGDFGPPMTGESPSKEDFEKTLWVSTKQNGLRQIWAPRWTMFSRGNVKEKARLLGFKNRRAVSCRTSESWAADLYAGIGYFVFSYAAMGMRVLCWEINPWSVEGLRRGAAANRWSVKVVCGDDLQLSLKDIMAGGEQIIVFLESNEQASRRMTELHELGIAEDVEHVNCGFLPTSEPVWRASWEMTRFSQESWLHLHENVGVQDTDERGKVIQGLMDGWAASEASGRKAVVEHVELVKTFAPGVWHCVFDVHVTQPVRQVEEQTDHET